MTAQVVTAADSFQTYSYTPQEDTSKLKATITH